MDTKESNTQPSKYFSPFSDLVFQYNFIKILTPFCPSSTYSTYMRAGLTVVSHVTTHTRHYMPLKAKIYRAVGRSENPGGASSNVVGTIFPLVQIGLTDQSNSGAVHGSPGPPATTALYFFALSGI